MDIPSIKCLPYNHRAYDRGSGTILQNLEFQSFLFSALSYLYDVTSSKDFIKYTLAFKVSKALLFSLAYSVITDILPKIGLSGLQVLLSSANAAELSGACGHIFQVISPCFRFRISPYQYRVYPNLTTGWGFVQYATKVSRILTISALCSLSESRISI